jgi:hypothetical protein
MPAARPVAEALSAPERSQTVTRRRFLIGGGAIAAAAAGAVVIDRVATASGSVNVPHVALPGRLPGLPARQHAWDASLTRDQFGNPVAPKYDRLLFFGVRGKPTPAYARLLEATLRGLEHTYAWGPQGLLFVAAWGSNYFTDVLRTQSPIPRAKPLSDFETPAIDEYDLCLHLACDDPQRLQTVERVLRRTLRPILAWRETRTGFVGAGIPAAHQRVSGIPSGDPVPKSSPLFMGFKSNLKKNQATEDAVTIADGTFTGGTTMHVSYMRLTLDGAGGWYEGLTYAERVARMYSPQTTPQDVSRITTDAESNPNEFSQAISRYGVVGHAQSSARARRDGKPIILRRDFNSTDGGQAGLHFVSVQRTIDDFITTRTAMNASSAQLENPEITNTVNNGINEFIFVTKRANYIVPTRAHRSFPSLPGGFALI